MNVKASCSSAISSSSLSGTAYDLTEDVTERRGLFFPRGLIMEGHLKLGVALSGEGEAEDDVEDNDGKEDEDDGDEGKDMGGTDIVSALMIAARDFA